MFGRRVSCDRAYQSCRSSRGDILRMVAMGQVRLGSIVGSDFYALMRRCTFTAELHGPLKCKFFNISVRADCLPQAAPCGATLCQLGSTIHELDRMQQAFKQPTSLNLRNAPQEPRRSPHAKSTLSLDSTWAGPWANGQSR
jgi:hypothetical protein